MDAEPTQTESLELPQSIARILRFVEDLGGLSQPAAGQAPGAAGLAANKFAESKTETFVGALLEKIRERYELVAADFLEFSAWIRQAFMPAPMAPLGEPLEWEEAVHPDEPAAPRRRRRRRSFVGVPENEDLGDALEPDQERPRSRPRLVADSFSFGLPMIALASIAPVSLGAGDSALFVPQVAAISTTTQMGMAAAYASAGPDLVYANPLTATLVDPIARAWTLATMTNENTPRSVRIALASSAIAASDPVTRMAATSALGRLAGETAPMPLSPTAAAVALPTVDAFAGLGTAPISLSGPPLLNPMAIPKAAQLGQITLVAPPAKVQGAGPGAPSAPLIWSDLAKGASPLTLDDVEDLAATAPLGTQALYPALAPGSLGPSAVNLPLAPETIDHLITQGYGKPPEGVASSIASFAWQTPATIQVPWPVLPPAQATDARLPVAKSGPLDVRGLPVHLSPGLGKSHETISTRIASSDLRSVPSSTIPASRFSPFQQRHFPHLTIHPVAAPHAAVHHEKVAPIHTAGPTIVRPNIVLGHQSAAHHPVKAAPPVLRSHAPIAHAPKPIAVASAPHSPSIPTHGAGPLKPQVVLPPAPTVGRGHCAPILEKHSTPRSVGAHTPSAPIQLPAHPKLEHEKPDLSHLAMPEMAPIIAPPHETTIVKPHLHAPAIHANIAPDLPLAKPKAPAPAAPLAIQTAKDSGVSPASQTQSSQTSTTQAAPSGASGKDAEVRLLANEVYSLLRRRLAFEAVRMGKR